MTVIADHEASPQQVTKWSRTLSDEFLLCRDIGHPWRPYTAAYDPVHNAYKRTLRCPRCTTEKVQLVSLSGHISTGHYNYPDGYQQEPGSGRLTGSAKDALRIESVMRLLGKEG